MHVFPHLVFFPHPRAKPSQLIIRMTETNTERTKVLRTRVAAVRGPVLEKVSHQLVDDVSCPALDHTV
jgi:hypothetical protein